MPELLLVLFFVVLFGCAVATTITLIGIISQPHLKDSTYVNGEVTFLYSLSNPKRWVWDWRLDTMTYVIKLVLIGGLFILIHVLLMVYLPPQYTVLPGNMM